MFFCRRRTRTSISCHLMLVSIASFPFFHSSRFQWKTFTFSYFLPRSCQSPTAPPPSPLRRPQRRPIRRQLLRPAPGRLHQRLQQRPAHAALGVVHHPASSESRLSSLNLVRVARAVFLCVVEVLAADFKRLLSIWIFTLSSCYSSPVSWVLVFLIMRSGFSVNHGLGPYHPVLNDGASENADLFVIKPQPSGARSKHSSYCTPRDINPSERARTPTESCNFTACQSLTNTDETGYELVCPPEKSMNHWEAAERDWMSILPLNGFVKNMQSSSCHHSSIHSLPYSLCPRGLVGKNISHSPLGAI